MAYTFGTYGVKYRVLIFPFDTTNEIYIDILKLSYSGSITQLQAVFQSCFIKMDATEYFTQLNSRGFEMQVLNNLVNFFQLDELFSISAFQFAIKVYDSTYTYFNGFIPCDVIEQQYIMNGIATVAASDNLKQLDQQYPTILRSSQNFRLIDIITDCLQQTGLNLPIYVNCSIYAVGYGTKGNCFEDLYLKGDLFLASVSDDTYTGDNPYNNTDYDYLPQLFVDCETILEAILLSFSCVLYYWNDTWYIERVKDLGTHEKVYKVYNGIESESIDTNYDESEHVLYIGRLNDSLIRYANASQVISYTPGLKEIDLTLDQQETLNFFNFFYTNVQVAFSIFYITEGTFDDIPWNDYTLDTYVPPLNIWTVPSWVSVTNTPAYYRGSNNVFLQDNQVNELTTISWWGVDLPIHAEHYNACGQPCTGTYLEYIGNQVIFDNDRFISIIEGQQLAIYSSLSGLYTKFKITWNEYDSVSKTENDTTLTFSFNFQLPESFKNTATWFMEDVYNSTIPYPATVETGTSEPVYALSQHIFYVRFYMSFPDTAKFLGPAYTLLYLNKNSNGKWQIGNAIQEANFTFGLCPIARDVNGIPQQIYVGFNYLEIPISFDQFTDKTNFAHSFSIDINLTEAINNSYLSFASSALTAQEYLSNIIFGLGEIGYNDPHSMYVNTNKGTGVNLAIKQSIYSDLTLTLNGSPPNNVIIGSINADFIEKKGIDLLVFDTTSYDFLNTLYVEPKDSEGDLDQPVEWNDAFNSANNEALYIKVIEDYFQIYNKVRHMITSDLYYKGVLKPFAMISDSNYTNNFYLNGFQWILDSNIYSRANLKEYVANDGIS